MQLKGGMPTIQVRDLTVQRRDNDLVLATFGRGFYILDDYSPLREITPQALADEAHLFPLRDAALFAVAGGTQSPAGAAGTGPMAGNWTAPNPPFGAVLTYSVRQDLPADTKLVVTITDDAGKQIRRMDSERNQPLPKSAGIHRVAWDLRTDPPPAPAGRTRRGRRRRGGRRRWRAAARAARGLAAAAVSRRRSSRPDAITRCSARWSAPM